MKYRAIYLTLIIISFAAGMVAEHSRHTLQPSKYQFISNQGIIFRADTTLGQLQSYRKDTAEWVTLTGDPFDKVGAK